MGLITKWQCQLCGTWFHTQRGALLCDHGRRKGAGRR